MGVLTAAGYTLKLNLPTVSFLYLLVVVLQSLLGDFPSSATLSVICFLCLNYFFVQPLFSFRVSDASDTTALIAFLITGLVITRLTSRAQQAAISEKSQREATNRLYDLARELLALNPEAEVRGALLNMFRSHFKLRAISFFDADSANLRVLGESTDLGERTRAAYIGKREHHEPIGGVSIHLIPSGRGTMGAIGFEGLQDSELIARPLAALAEIVLERSAAFRRASRAVATTEAEIFRGAVLDALAHEFKTPLTTILTAAGALKEESGLPPEKMELLEAVESETFRLSQLTSRLLRLAQLDREEVTPQLELIDITEIVKSMVEQYAQRVPDRRLHLVASETHPVLGDRELLWLGLGQLIDNACKYSLPKSEITVSIEAKDEMIAIHVWNSGTSIPSSERNRIFERFYRGQATRSATPGSGLGLYVARKIAVAHRGTLDLDEPSEAALGTGFRFVIPCLGKELIHDSQIQPVSGR